MGDWIDMTNAKPAPWPKGVPSCPLCKGEGQYIKKDAEHCYDRGEHWTEDLLVICTRCTYDKVFERELKELEQVNPYAVDKLLKPLAEELRRTTGTPLGTTLNEDVFRALSSLARLLRPKEVS